MLKALPLITMFLLTMCITYGQKILKAPDRSEGDGPYSQLIIRGATLINGTGAPPIGPVDIVVENHRISNIKVVGYPGVPIEPSDRPVAQAGGREIDAHGMYVLPGLIDMHGHIGGSAQGAYAEYVFKLWMAHGITTIRDPSCSNGLDWVLEHKRKSTANEITAPRIFAYTTFGQGNEDPITSPADARDWVKKNANHGADGIKFFGTRPDIMKAASTKISNLDCVQPATMLKWM